MALQVHPLVLELTGKTEPRTGLEGKFSIYHAAAVALIEGEGGEEQFSDRAVNDPAIVALRRRVTATVDPAMAPDAAHIALALADGSRAEAHVKHAIGSIARPMTDADLERKFLALTRPHLGEARARQLLDLAWRIETLDSAATVAEAAGP